MSFKLKNITVFLLFLTVSYAAKTQGDASLYYPVCSPISIVATITNTSCNANNGAIDITVSGGTSPYIYNWGGVYTTEDINNLSLGEYTVMITDKNSCSEKYTFYVSVGSNIKLDYKTTAPTCLTCADGAIDLIINGGTSPFTYQWSNGTTTEDIQNLLAGKYSVTVTDATTCLSRIGIELKAAPTTENICVQWAKTYNGPDMLTDAGFAIDVNENVYVAGVSQISNKAGVDISIIKYDKSGQQLWVNSFTSPKGALELSLPILRIDLSGNIITAFKYQEAVINSDGQSVVTGYDYMLVKYNPQGELQWYARYDGTAHSNDEIMAMETDASGNIYVTGGTSTSESGNVDYTTIKYNSNGQQQWIASYNGTGNSNDFANSIAIDATGNVYVTGKSNNSINNISVNNDYATIKYDANGQQQWVAVYNGSANQNDNAQKVVLDNAGNIFVTGRSVNSSGNGDIVTIKYNNSGTQLWQSVYASTDNADEISTNLYIYNNNDVFVAGGAGGSTARYLTINYDAITGGQKWASEFNSGIPYNGNGSFFATRNFIIDGAGNSFFTGNIYSTTLQSDLVTVKYNPQGQQQWANIYEGTGNGADAGFGIALSPENEVYVTGLSHNGSNFDFLTLKYGKCSLCSLSVTINETNYSNGCNYSKMLTANANQQATYLWSNGSNSQSITVTTSGTYTVTATASNCTASASTTISFPAPLQLSLNAQTYPNGFNISAYGGSDGSIGLTVAGGASPFTYNWSNGATVEDISGLPAGNYSVTVKDANNCSSSASITLTQPPQQPPGGTLTGFGWNNFGNSTVILPQTNLNVYGDVYIESEGQIQNDGNIRLTNDWINHKPLQGGNLPPPSKGPRRHLAVGEQGTVLSRGETDIVFSESLSGKTANLRTIASYSPEVAYAAGDAGTVIKSTDAGETWESLSCGTMNDLQGMDFINDYTGIVVGKNAEIRTTNDSGITWTARTAPIDNTIALSDVMYADENTLYAVGEQGTIIKSIDGGVTWEKLTSPVTKILYAVKTHDVMTGYAVGESGIILYTNDGGANWIIQNSGTTETLRSICCAGEGELCVVGDNNTILRTSDAGTTWTTVSSGLTEPTRLNRIHFAEDAKTGYVAGDAGTLLQSKDAGMTWERQAVSSSKNLFDVAPKESRGENLSGVGTVELFGAEQKIKGSRATNFFNINLNGSAIKSMEQNASVNGVLDLGNREMATQDATLQIFNADPAAIKRTGGFISSEGIGTMMRVIGFAQPYLFPVGSSKNTARYRPVEIIPTTETSQIYSVKLINHNPSDDGYDISTRESSVTEVNSKYYHFIQKLKGSGSEPVNMVFYFNKLDDNQFNKIAYWNNIPQWSKANPSDIFLFESPDLSFIKLYDWDNFINKIFAFSIVDYTEFSGVFTIGGNTPDYNSISQAINTLNGKKLIGDVIYRIRNGSYNESVNLGREIDYIKNHKDIMVAFVPDDTLAPDILVQSDNFLNIKGKNNLLFMGLKFNNLGSDIGMTIKYSSDINFLSNDVTSSTTANTAMQCYNVSNLGITNCSFKNYFQGILADKGSGTANIELIDIAVDNQALFLSGFDMVNLLSGKVLCTNPLSEYSLKITEIAGNGIISANELSGSKNCILIEKSRNNFNIENNSISASNSGTGIFIKSFSGNMSLAGNTITAVTGQGIKVKDASNEAGSLDSVPGKKLLIKQNKISQVNDGINIYNTVLSNISIIKNEIIGSQQGILLGNIANNSPYNIDLAGNLVVSANNGILMNNTTLASSFKANTIIANGSGLSKTIALANVDNMIFCSNNMVNFTSAEVFSVNGTIPSNIITSWNNWYSFVSNNVSSYENLIFSATDLKLDPRFKGSSNYGLKPGSPLLNLPIACRDSSVYYDLYGGLRFPNYDIGAIESVTSAIDGKNIEFVLEDGIAFSPNTGSSYPRFQINGLAEYSDVELRIFSQAGNLVFESTSKTDFWEGNNLFTSQPVPQGPYNYVLNLDGQAITGFVYVKR